MKTALVFMILSTIVLGGEKDAWIPASSVKALHEQIAALKAENAKLKEELAAEKKLSNDLLNVAATPAPQQAKTVYVPISMDERHNETVDAISDVAREVREMNDRERDKEWRRDFYRRIRDAERYRNNLKP